MSIWFDTPDVEALLHVFGDLNSKISIDVNLGNSIRTFPLVFELFRIKDFSHYLTSNLIVITVAF